jgi:hypothetical protein
LGQVLIDEGTDHARRTALQSRELVRIQETGLPVIELPFLTDGVDLGGLYELAQVMTDSGVR